MRAFIVICVVIAMLLIMFHIIAETANWMWNGPLGGLVQFVVIMGILFFLITLVMDGANSRRNKS